MLKNVIISLIVLLAIGWMFPFESAFAEEVTEYQCEITIDANKHDWNNQAHPTDGCDGSVINGFWDGENFSLIGDNTTQVLNGEIVDLGIGNHLKVHTISKKEDSKPEPKPKPKPDSKPNSDSKPKPKPEKKPKPESKPKQKSESVSKDVDISPSTDSSAPSNESKKEQSNNSTTKTDNTKDTSDSESKKSPSKEKKTVKEKKPNKKRNEKDDGKDKSKKDKKNNKDKTLSVEKLFEKNATIQEKNRGMFAVYMDDKDKKVEQELTDEETEKLKKMQKDAKKEKSEDVVVKKDEHTTNESDRNTPFWFVGGSIGLLVVVGLITYVFVKRQKNKETSL